MIIHNINRLLITSLTVMGLAMDGFQSADIMFGTALFLWLYLSELDKFEAKILAYFAQRKRDRENNVTKPKVF
ncbi:MAG: hypothetical protein QM500_13185 [Methylococcales bacterium]